MVDIHVTLVVTAGGLHGEAWLHGQQRYFMSQRVEGVTKSHVGAGGGGRLGEKGNWGTKSRRG